MHFHLSPQRLILIHYTTSKPDWKHLNQKTISNLTLPERPENRMDDNYQFLATSFS
jgi:hypothetical protein